MKSKDCATKTPLKTGGELQKGKRFLLHKPVVISRRVRGSCSTNRL
jgi:hypothetical protein